MEEQKEPKVRSLYKALKLLDHFDHQNAELGVTELAQLADLQKSTVHNIMQTFELCEIVQKNTRTNKYRLGKKILELSHKFSLENTFQDQLKTYMKEISSLTHENVYFAVPYEKKIIYIDAFSYQDPFLSKSILGTVAPMHCTGLGKAILSQCTDPFVDSVLNAPLERYTEYTITDPDALRQEIASIRKRSYAIDNMEHEYGVKCIAIPLIENNTVVGGLSLSGPSLRFTSDKIEEYAVLLKGIAQKLKLQS